MIALFQKDFDKLPQNIRYFFYLGILLIANAWLLDHWLPNQALPYLYLGRLDLRSFSYNVGTTSLIFFLGLTFWKQVKFIPFLITSYNEKYPINDIGKKFDLIWFNGKLMLFDHKERKYFHVYPWETAEDLDFVSFGTHVEDRFPNPITTIVKLDTGKELNTSSYENGGSINTRK